MKKPDVLVQGAKSQAVMMHGDCLERMEEIPEGSVDMVFADLPYGVTQNKWDVVVPMDRLWLSIMRSGKASSAFVFSACHPFGARLICSNEKFFRYEIIWDKVRTGRWMSAKYMPLSRHENICVFYARRPTYNAQMTARDKPSKIGGIKAHTTNFIQSNRHKLSKNTVYTHRFPDTILAICRENNTVHPTQKPVALLEWLIRTYTNEGDTVLDPTAGSGTTAVAALNTGRNAICIEKDPTYFDVMCKRVRESQVPAAQTELALG